MSSWPFVYSLVSTSLCWVRSRFFRPYACGWNETRIGLMKAFSGEVPSGMSADRPERDPRRSNRAATTSPAPLSQSRAVGSGAPALD